MKSIDVFVPTKVVFGCGVFSRLGEIAKEYGTKALIVTTGIPGTDIIERACQMLKDAGLGVALYEKVEPNPKDYNIDDGAALYFKEGCDLIIGIGGGSAIDAAKGISCIAENGGQISDYVPLTTAKIRDLKKCAPVITVTTTAGTGSEVTSLCVVTLTKQNHCKPTFAYPCMYAKAAIVDPELTLTMPKRGTAMVGIDVFFHGMEQYISRNASEFTDLYSETAMRWVVKYLPQVLKNPSDMEARSRMHLASTLAGYSITIGSCCTLHGIGQALSSITDMPHGLSLCVFATSFMRHTYDGWIPRYANVARILDPSLENVSDEEAAKKSGDVLEKFIQSIGLPSNAKDLNLTDEMVEKIAQDVFTWTPRGAKQLVKDATPELVRDIVNDAR